MAAPESDDIGAYPLSVARQRGKRDVRTGVGLENKHSHDDGIINNPAIFDRCSF